VHSGAFFNRQRLGLKVKDFERESSINKRYQVVATINSGPLQFPSSSTNPSMVNKEEYIAILESLDMPLYFILYDVSYSQYVYSERYFVSGGKQLVDHSIPSRSHAQYLASQLHDEAAHCKHRFTNYELLQSLLISKTGELADIEYTTTRGDDHSNMPEGLETQEVYLFKSS